MSHTVVVDDDDDTDKPLVSYFLSSRRLEK